MLESSRKKERKREDKVDTRIEWIYLQLSERERESILFLGYYN